MTDFEHSYPALSQEVTREWVNAVTDQSEVELPHSSVKYINCSTPYREEIEEAIVAELDAVMGSFPAELPKNLGGEVESTLVGPLGPHFASIPAEAIVDAEFWMYLSVFHASHFLLWRFGAGKKQNPTNFGAGPMHEGALFRIFLRGQVAFDSSREDPYEIAKLGDMDLWRSHILRQKYGRSRNVVRALLLLQDSRLDAVSLRVSQVRELARELNRVYSNVSFELLTDADAQELVIELAERCAKSEGLVTV